MKIVPMHKYPTSSISVRHWNHGTMVSVLVSVALVGCQIGPPKTYDVGDNLFFQYGLHFQVQLADEEACPLLPGPLPDDVYSDALALKHESPRIYYLTIALMSAKLHNWYRAYYKDGMPLLDLRDIRTGAYFQKGNNKTFLAREFAEMLTGAARTPTNVSKSKDFDNELWYSGSVQGWLYFSENISSNSPEECLLGMSWISDRDFYEEKGIGLGVGALPNEREFNSLPSNGGEK